EGRSRRLLLRRTGGRFLALDRLHDVAPSNRSAWPTALYRRQVNAPCAGEQFGTLRDLHAGGLGTAVGWGRLRGRWLGLRPRGFLGGGSGARLDVGRVRRRAAVGPDFNFGQRRTDRDRLAGVGKNLQQLAGCRRGHFRVHLVGGDLDQRLAFTHRVAGLLQPFGDGPLRDRLTHLRQGDLHGRLGHGGILPTKLGFEYELQGEAARQRRRHRLAPMPWTRSRAGLAAALGRALSRGHRDV